MAKACMINRESKRQKLVVRGKSHRSDLKAIIKDPEADFDAKQAAVMALDSRKRDESATRLRTRCISCGRPRAVYKKFGLCRICLRNCFVKGWLPGLVKSSW